MCPPERPLHVGQHVLYQSIYYHPVHNYALTTNTHFWNLCPHREELHTVLLEYISHRHGSIAKVNMSIAIIFRHRLYHVIASRWEKELSPNKLQHY